MPDILQARGNTTQTLRHLLDDIRSPFAPGDLIGIKVHWGERGNGSFLSPQYSQAIVRWLLESGMQPFIFDTTVLYSGGRRTAADSLKTASEHGFTEGYFGCPVLIGDGPFGRDVLNIQVDYPHFHSIEVASIVRKAHGFVIFSHFKGHVQSGFGGAIKNLSMGFASRAQKQRIHADAHPQLIAGRCNRCGLCAEVCPSRAVVIPPDSEPIYDLKTCIGCSQCIGLCPQKALKIFWGKDVTVFQERLVETAAAVWKEIGGKSLIINALLNITSECDCLPGSHSLIADDFGFIVGNHPLTVDEASVNQIGEEPFNCAHPGLRMLRQFTYAREIGFCP